jgi:hypothetical protein
VTLPTLPDPLSGVVQITPTLAGGPLDHVELWIDGSLTQTVTSAPWTLSWDTTGVTAGQHVLAVRAVGPRGRATAAITPVQVQQPQP